MPLCCGRRGGRPRWPAPFWRWPFFARGRCGFPHPYPCSFSLGFRWPASAFAFLAGKQPSGIFFSPITAGTRKRPPHRATVSPGWQPRYTPHQTVPPRRIKCAAAAFPFYSFPARAARNRYASNPASAPSASPAPSRAMPAPVPAAPHTAPARGLMGSMSRL